MKENGEPLAGAPHRDVTRVIESEPQTQHKVDLIGPYYGQYPEILIAAAPSNPQIDPSHIWLIEACAGAGTYRSSEHPAGYVDGCAILACRRAREIQRQHPAVTMHIVLIESDPGYCAQLAGLIREFTEASGRDRVDVRIEPARFEDKVDEVLSRTRKGDGLYYYSLWFIDPDGVLPIPHRAIECICSARRGPEVIVNLSASGLARIVKAARTPSASALGQRARATEVFGNDRWESLPDQESWEMELYQTAEAYAKSFPKMRSSVYKLRSNGDEVRYFVQLTRSSGALRALDKTYRSSQHTGLYKGRKLTIAEKARYAQEMVAMMARATTNIEAVYKAMGGRLDRSQTKWVLNYAASNGFGSFNESGAEFTWNEQQAVVPRILPKIRQKHLDEQASLFPDL